MTALLLLQLWIGITRTAEIQPYAQGYLTHYAPKLAESVLDRRMRLYGLQPYYGYVPACLIALNEDHVGEYVKVVYHECDADNVDWIICYVVDVDQRDHPDDRPGRGLVGEVNHSTWRYGNGPVSIYPLALPLILPMP